ncbi:hypothetical protein [Streptomyces narbonensis]|uniref:hypothetical protein n=1 Tax=Streptomyces narbonensis TaxID=67333 RepID=UPI0033F0B284
MSSEPWTIERICDALGNPALTQRFLGQINRAPAHELLTVFAKWERIAKDTVAAVERGRELAAYDARSEEAPGLWIDATDRIRTAVDQSRTSGAA